MKQYQYLLEDVVIKPFPAVQSTVEHVLKHVFRMRPVLLQAAAQVLARLRRVAVALLAQVRQVQALQVVRALAHLHRVAVALLAQAARRVQALLQDVMHQQKFVIVVTELYTSRGKILASTATGHVVREE